MLLPSIVKGDGILQNPHCITCMLRHCISDHIGTCCQLLSVKPRQIMLSGCKIGMSGQFTDFRLGNPASKRNRKKECLPTYVDKLVSNPAILEIFRDI